MTRWAAALAAGLVCATPAAAQLAQNSDAPVDVTADELEVLNSKCVSIWKGAAEALQADARLRADVLRVYYKPKSSAPAASGSNNCGLLDKMEAEGSVYYVTPQQRVRGDAAVYTADNETIVMTGDVVAAQGQNVLRGRRLVINVKTGEGRMETGVKGRNKPGRVRGVFYPNEKQPAAQPPARR